MLTKKTDIIGSYAPDFELPGVDSQVHHLARYLKTHQVVGVIFMCNHCPEVNLYLERLKQIQTSFKDRGFTLIGINASDANQHQEDSFENMKTFAAEKNLNFPYLWDSTQDVAHSFDAEKTPEVFLLDKNGILRYCGAIDDNAQEPEAVQVHYLRDALTALLAGEAVTLASTEAIGCSIQWAQ